MYCLVKYHAGKMKTPSAGAFIFVKLIRGCLPVFDELCQRSMCCVRSCLSHDSYLIRFVANNAVVHARSQSILGRNVLFCAHRYNCSVNICLVHFII